MALFLSTFVNKVDKKGRVSVPAPFRAVLAGQAFPGIAAYPSLVEPAIEACGLDRMAHLSESVDQYNPFGDQHRAFAKALFGRTHQLAWDSEGRIQLPEKLRDFAGITEFAAFVGLGPTFQIWEPGAAEANEEEALTEALAASSEFSLVKPSGGGS